MSIFSISDLHLSLSVEKPMDKFGNRWVDYVTKLEKRWRAVVSDDDTVVVPGDISWAMTLEESLSDFRFIDSLPGTKLIGKGNHDFWWTTAAKMNTFLSERGITTVRFLYNNAYRADEYIIAGSRGWFVLESYQKTVGDVDYARIVARECIRLKMSLDCALKLRHGDEKILCYFHFPPVFSSFVCREIVDVLHEYNITNCYFGHIHGVYELPRTIEFEGISFTNTAADFLDFIPMITCP